MRPRIVTGWAPADLDQIPLPFPPTRNLFSIDMSEIHDGGDLGGVSFQKFISYRKFFVLQLA